MIKTTLRLNGLIFLCTSLLLTACGGGGGGGGFVEPIPDANQGGDDGPVFQDGTPYEQMFNEFLPLTHGSKLQYENTLIFSSTAEMDITLEDDQTEPHIYSLGLDFDTNAMKMHVSSTPEEILIHRIVGPIEVGSYTVNSLELDEPIVLYNGQGNSDSIDAVASVKNFGSLPLTVTYSSSSTQTVFDESYGVLPTITITFDAELSSSLLGGEIGSLNTSLELAKGIGIVRNTGNYIGEAVAHDIQALVNLPQTIWFENNSGTPILSSDSDDQVRINGVLLKPSLYELLNDDEIEALGWIKVREDTASDSFVVEMNSASNLPTTLTSVELVFERKSDQLRMSGNVTLLPQI